MFDFIGTTLEIRNMHEFISYESLGVADLFKLARQIGDEEEGIVLDLRNIQPILKKLTGSK